MKEMETIKIAGWTSKCIKLIPIHLVLPSYYNIQYIQGLMKTIKHFIKS